MLDADVVIIGAGVTGLSAAFHLSALAPDKKIVVLEEDRNIGGQSQSMPLSHDIADTHGLFTTWEKGVHTLFTQDSYVYGFYDSLGVVRQPRSAQLVIRTDPLVTIDYPYQANKDKLPSFMQAEVPARSIGASNEKCFAAELLRTYGQTHCDNFFMPYNEKKFGRSEVWQLPADWGQRKHRGQETGKGHCPELVYPKDRDFQAMPDALRQRCGKNVTVLRNHSVLRIDMTRRTLYFAQQKVQLTGTTVPKQTLRYKVLINTAFDTLDDWNDKTQPMLPWLLQPRYVRLAAVLTPTSNVVNPGIQWYVVADAKLDLIRVSNHNAVRSVPEHPQTLLIAEFDDYTKVGTEEYSPAMTTLEQLQFAGVIKDTVGMFSTQALNTGILYSQDARKGIDEYVASLKPFGVWSIGRFGNAEYIDCDECIVAGRDTALEVLK